MIYGTPQFHNVHDVTDRIGIRTLIISKMWQTSRWPLTIAEQDAERPVRPEVPGGMLYIGEQTQDIKGGYRTLWTFEGVNGDGKSVTFKQRTNSLDYEFQPGFEQADIRKHPKIQELMEKYGGVLDPSSLQIIWPITNDSGNTTTRGLGGGASSGSEDRNPMFGRNEFLQLTGIYTFRYASFSPPSLAMTNKILKSGALPGSPPAVGDLNWLAAPPPYKRVGMVFDITEIYWLSGPGGWPVPIYTLAAGGDSTASRAQTEREIAFSA